LWIGGLELYLKDNIADVENRKNRVVVVTRELEILLKTSKAGIADVCSIDETEEVE
jgi:hypothetical protein